MNQHTEKKSDHSLLRSFKCSQRDAPDLSLRKHIYAVNGQYSGGLIRTDNEP